MEKKQHIKKTRERSWTFLIQNAKAVWKYHMLDKHTACYDIRYASLCTGSYPLNFETPSPSFKRHMMHLPTWQDCEGEKPP